MEKVDVCIVGAGPGGALLGYLLAKKGISVLLIERTNSVAKAFRGEHVNVEGEEILKKYNLFNEIEQLGLLKMKNIEYWFNGEKIKSIDADPKVGHLGIHVPQAHLLQAILNKALAYPNFQFCLKTTLEDLVQNEAGQYVAIKAIREGVQSTVACKLIVGADGRYSAVRKKASIHTTERKHGYDLLWARIPAPKVWTPSIKMALVDGQQISVFSQTNDFIQIGWNIPAGSFASLRKQSFEPFIEKLVKAFPELTETVQTHIQSWKDFVLLDVFSSVTEEWTRKGLALLGDAVHTMTPTGAYGLNCAMKDAEILAELINIESLNGLDLQHDAELRQREIAEIQAIQIEKEQSFENQFTVLV